MKTTTVGEITVVRGENASENWAMIGASEGSWLWLHLNSFPSPHVIVQHCDPPAEVLAAAAEMCKEGSKYKRLRNLKVCYTKVSNLQKGYSVGSVEYRSNRQVKTLKL